MDPQVTAGSRMLAYLSIHVVAACQPMCWCLILLATGLLLQEGVDRQQAMTHQLDLMFTTRQEVHQQLVTGLALHINTPACALHWITLGPRPPFPSLWL
jgi:hypothetical protein